MLINNDTYQRETLSEGPIWQPFNKTPKNWLDIQLQKYGLKISWTQENWLRKFWNWENTKKCYLCPPAPETPSQKQKQKK